MSLPAESSPDLVRWTFATDPERSGEIEAHLDELGADVLVRDGQTFLVTWDEPETDLDGVIEAIWAIHGSPFEVTQEEFRRLALHSLNQAEDEPSRDAA